MIKYSFFYFLVLLSCVSLTQQDKGSADYGFELGIYRYNRDSVESPNPRFAESIELKRDNSFIYKVRTGSFIRLELSGDWQIKGDSLILDGYSNIEETLLPKSCNAQNGYLFDVKGLDGYPLNYSLSINDGSKWIRELHGPYTLDSDYKVESLQVVTSSGLYSKRFMIPSDTNCFEVKISNKRYFKNEVWIIRENGLQPIGFDGKLAKYYLYKEDK